MNVRAVAGIWLTFKGRSPPEAGLSQWLFIWRTFTRTASTLLYFPLGNILVQPLSAPFVFKCLIWSPMIKHGFLLHALDGVQVFWYYCIWNPDTVEFRSVGWTADLTCSYVILHFWLVANPMKLNENWRQEQRRVRFEDRIHLTQMLYMLKWPTDCQGQ